MVNSPPVTGRTPTHARDREIQIAATLATPPLAPEHPVVECPSLARAVADSAAVAVTVRNDPEHERYVALVDGEPAGFAAYRRRPGLIAFTHTEVNARFEGRGVGSALARAALDEARGNGDVVLPFCRFINGWISEHADYRDLVPEDRRAAFSL
jgi:uncharacterized protein